MRKKGGLKKLKVVNLNGSSDKSCSCGSWLKHWENYNSKGQRVPYLCPSCGLAKVEVGAHVRKYGSLDNDTYIVPLCKGCNNQSSSISLDIGDCALAPASRANTCGY